MIKRQIRMELDRIQNELKMNLENNYKDLAHDALLEFHNTLESYKENGSIKEKDYLKYKTIANDYSKKMEHYHH